jgi:hypothetical protein
MNLKSIVSIILLINLIPSAIARSGTDNYDAIFTAILGFGLVTVIAIILINFIPTFIAYSRNKENRFLIFIFNLLVGWTLIGWIIAFIWACMSDKNNYREVLYVNKTNNNYENEFIEPSLNNYSENKLDTPLIFFSLKDRTLSNDAFKLFLIDYFDIAKHKVIGQFVMAGKIYPDLEDALLDACDLYEDELKKS